MKHYSPAEKNAILTCYYDGTLSETSLFRTPSRSTLYRWIKEEQERDKTSGLPSRREIFEMRRKMERQKQIIEVLQTCHCRPEDSLQIKLPMIEEQMNCYPVNLLCEALKVPKGTFYNFHLRGQHTHHLMSDRHEMLKENVLRVFEESSQIYGAGKIEAVLRSQGICSSPRTILKIMRELGIESIRQSSKKEYDRERRMLKDRVQQQFTVTRPNEVWVGDVTYYMLLKSEQRFYIAVVIDLYSRKVVGYAVGKKNTTQLIRRAFENAYEQRNPDPEKKLIFHSDRGSNYRSRSYRTYLKERGITQSFSRPHIPYENSVVESFFKTMKLEELYRTKYRSEREFRTAVDSYIHFFNEKRPHASNGYKTPEEVETAYSKRHDKGITGK